MVILEHILSSRTLVPVRTDYMVIYPGLLPWDTVAANKLLFFHNGANLRPHPEVVYMLVHVFSPPPHVMPRKQCSMGIWMRCSAEFFGLILLSMMWYSPYIQAHIDCIYLEISFCVYTKFDIPRIFTISTWSYFTIST